MESCPKEVAENLRLRPVRFPWMRPHLWQLLGHRPILQAHHHHRQVHLLIFGLSVLPDLKKYRLGLSFKNVNNPKIYSSVYYRTVTNNQLKY